MKCSALFIDLENLGGPSLRMLIQTTRERKELTPLKILRVYSHWDIQSVRTKSLIMELGCDPIAVRERGKNSSDAAIKKDIASLLEYFPSIDTYVIASCDGGFRTTFDQIREHKKVAVLCSSEATASIALRKACDRFIPILASGGSGMAQGDSLGSDAPVFNGIEDTIAVRAGELNVNGRILHMLEADYRDKLEDSGVPIASLSEKLRAFKDPRDGKRRWLIKLLKSATNGDGELCLARSGSGDCRVFAAGSVPDGWLVLDE